MFVTILKKVSLKQEDLQHKVGSGCPESNVYSNIFVLNICCHPSGSHSNNILQPSKFFWWQSFTKALRKTAFRPDSKTDSKFRVQVRNAGPYPLLYPNLGVKLNS